MNIILDFDGTITARDTIGTLVDFAVAHHRRQHPGSPDRAAAAWAEIVRAYAADLDAHARAGPAPEHERTALAHEVGHLRGLRAVEARSLRRVEAAGLFAGLDADRLFAAGGEAVRRGEVRVRDGFAALVREAARAEGGGARVAVVSVNWSAAWIRGVMSAAGVGPAAGVEVVANEVGPGGTITGPEALRRRRPGGGEGADPAPLVTSEDKVLAMRAVLAERGGDERQTVYFGDSPTDLECLLEARGVVVADDEESKLVRTLRRLGYAVPHISARDAGGDSPCWARDFQEVLAFWPL